MMEGAGMWVVGEGGGGGLLLLLSVRQPGSE